MKSSQAYDYLTEGHRIRLPHWPEGQYLKVLNKRVGVYREHGLTHPDHVPSATELASEEWVIYELPEGIEERDYLNWVPSLSS